MSKVLVDRELLESLAELGEDAINRMGSYLAEKHGEQRYVDAARAILAQPAEAEGVVAWAPSTALEKLKAGFNNAPCVLTDGPAEFNNVPLVTLAALSAVTAERDRHLANAYALCAETVAKGEQIEQLRAEVDALRKDAERYRWLRDPCSGAEHVIYYSRGDYGRGLMSGSMLDAAIDAAMAAKDPEPEHRMDAKVKAAALILAEIDRLDRAAARGGADDE